MSLDEFPVTKNKERRAKDREIYTSNLKNCGRDKLFTFGIPQVEALETKPESP